MHWTVFIQKEDQEPVLSKCDAFYVMLGSDDESTYSKSLTLFVLFLSFIFINYTFFKTIFLQCRPGCLAMNYPTHWSLSAKMKFISCQVRRKLSFWSHWSASRTIICQLFIFYCEIRWLMWFVVLTFSSFSTFFLIL